MEACAERERRLPQSPRMGVELAPAGMEEAANADAPPVSAASLADRLLTFLCRCVSCPRAYLALATEDAEELPRKRGRRRGQDRCRFSDKKPGRSTHATLDGAQSPLRVGRAGGALKLSPTVDVFVYDGGAPASRRGLAPGSVRENRDRVRKLRSVVGKDWSELDETSVARILGEGPRTSVPGPAFRWHGATTPPPPPAALPPPPPS